MEKPLEECVTFDDFEIYASQLDCVKKAAEFNAIVQQQASFTDTQKERLIFTSVYFGTLGQYQSKVQSSANRNLLESRGNIPSRVFPNIFKLISQSGAMSEDWASERYLGRIAMNLLRESTRSSYYRKSLDMIEGVTLSVSPDSDAETIQQEHESYKLAYETLMQIVSAPSKIVSEQKTVKEQVKKLIKTALENGEEPLSLLRRGVSAKIAEQLDANQTTVKIAYMRIRNEFFSKISKHPGFEGAFSHEFVKDVKTHVAKINAAVGPAKPRGRPLKPFYSRIELEKMADTEGKEFIR